VTAVVLVHDDREYLRRPGEELQTDLGVLTVPDDVSSGDVLETHLGEVTSSRHTSANALPSVGSAAPTSFTTSNAPARRCCLAISAS